MAFILGTGTVKGPLSFFPSNQPTAWIRSTLQLIFWTWRLRRQNTWSTTGLWNCLPISSVISSEKVQHSVLSSMLASKFVISSQTTLCVWDLVKFCTSPKSRQTMRPTMLRKERWIWFIQYMENFSTRYVV